MRLHLLFQQRERRQYTPSHGNHAEILVERVGGRGRRNVTFELKSRELRFRLEASLDVLENRFYRSRALGPSRPVTTAVALASHAARHACGCTRSAVTRRRNVLRAFDPRRAADEPMLISSPERA